MRITLTSVLVDDQAKALDFYTRVLGFEKKHEVPMGEFAWLTVVSPDAPDDVEAEHARLTAAGVAFTQPPVAMGPVTTAVFDDTCGNLIQIQSPVPA